LKKLLHTSPSASLATASAAGLVAADLARSTANTMKEHISEILGSVQEAAELGINNAKQQSDNYMALLRISVSCGITIFATTTNELMNAADSFISSVSNVAGDDTSEKD
jgi:hypothetical protein